MAHTRASSLSLISDSRRSFLGQPARYLTFTASLKLTSSICYKVENWKRPGKRRSCYNPDAISQETVCTLGCRNSPRRTSANLLTIDLFTMEYQRIDICLSVLRIVDQPIGVARS